MFKGELWQFINRMRTIGLLFQFCPSESYCLCLLPLLSFSDPLAGGALAAAAAGKLSSYCILIWIYAFVCRYKLILQGVLKNLTWFKM